MQLNIFFIIVLNTIRYLIYTAILFHYLLIAARIIDFDSAFFVVEFIILSLLNSELFKKIFKGIL